MVKSFFVTRTSESFVKPCKPTPLETLNLSSIDRVPGLRHMVPSLHVFKHGEEPAKLIKEALSKALVKYYPLAGRFVETENGELSVACTAAGVLFIEATADCHLEDVEYFDLPVAMIPLDELLPVASAELDLNITVPFMIQVTNFDCGGFVLGLSSCHTIADGLGVGQFMNAIAELSRGLATPTVDPVWLRDPIPDPKKLQQPNHQPPSTPTIPSYKLQYTTIDISLENINKLKSQYLELTDGERCSTFDVALAKLWQARTRAINFKDPEQDVHICFFADVRPYLHKLKMQQRRRFYGNAFYSITASSTAGFIARAELVKVVRIVRSAKARIAGEFEQWTKGEVGDTFDLTLEYKCLFVSDWTRLGFHDVDYGWGTPVNVVPLGLQKYMAKALLMAPPVPRKGARWTTLCVEEEHLATFVEEMNRF